MKKRLYVFGLVVMLSISALGCGKKKDKTHDTSDTSSGATTTESVAEVATPENAGDPKSDLLYFVNYSLPSIQGNKDRAVEIYNSYFDTDKADIEAYAKTLKDDAIPMMKEYIDELSALEVKTEEVEVLRQECLDSANKRYKALKFVLKAIDEQRKDFLSKANTYIKKAEQANDQYLADMVAMAEKYDVKVSGYEKPAQVGTTTDAETK